MQLFARHPRLKDVSNIILFAIAVVIGAWLINVFLFRSFDVYGPSMEPTLRTDDRLIVNRLPVTINALQGKDYLPERGHVIVFKNPRYIEGGNDEFVVKRVIGLPGERVVISRGEVMVYSPASPTGFDPYKNIDIETTPVSDTLDVIVPQGEIFVIGDNREGQFSLDSRNGLGTVPLIDIVGPVAMRVYPFTQISNDF